MPSFFSLRRLPGVLSSAVAVSLVVGLAVAALACWVADPIVLQNLRLAQFDQFQRWFPRRYQPAPVRIVDIDEASLKAYGQWPWPRTRLAELTQKLQDAGAAVVAFDVLLAEPDRTSPAFMAQQWNDPKVSALLKNLPDNDHILAQHLVAQNVVLGTSLSRTGKPENASKGNIPSPPYRIVSRGTDNYGFWLSAFDDIVVPLPALMSAAKGLGALNFVADADGVVRRVPLLLRLGDKAVPSLSAEALRVAQGAHNYLVTSSEAGISEVRVGAVRVKTNEKAEVLLYYTRPQPQRYVSAGKVLSGEIDPATLNGQLVLIGSSAAGLMDLRFNPLGEIMPGVEAHALALEQMLLGEYLERPAWMVGLEATLIVLVVLAGGFFSLAASARTAALVVPVALAALLGAAVYAFIAHHLLIDILYPVLMLVTSVVIGSSIHHWMSEREQRWVREAFSRYVSPNRVAHLVANRDQLQLGGRRQECSFVFTDLAGFTSMMEAGDPAQAVMLLNDYLEGMLAIVFRHDGTLDRIVGDAVAVLFSAPVPQADHRQRALNCALEMDKFATRYAADLNAKGVAWGHTRIGVHTGEVIVGNFGGKTLFDYRALGDPINTASRLESVNKHLGTRVCVSQAILDGCEHVAARFVGRLVLKGKSQPLAVYEPLAACDAEKIAPPQEYAAAMVLLNSENQQEADAAAQAQARFADLAQRFPHDPLVKLHLQRLQRGEESDLIVMSDK